MRMFHPRYSHHHHGGHFKGKLIFAGVALWLTSTIIAGVRRSTGWTHNAYGQPRHNNSSNNRNEEELTWQKFIENQSNQSHRYTDKLKLEQQYLKSAPDQHTRQLREQRLEEFFHSSRNPHFYRHQIHRPAGGFTLWYLGIGERTFDWVARRLGSSPRFHHEYPLVPYDVLVNDMVNREIVYRHSHHYEPYIAPTPYIASAAVAPVPAVIPTSQTLVSEPSPASGKSGHGNSPSSDTPAS
ncbi:hypothetical protein COEREDRAFT_80849 [Coemansia reversa NRRL 1564]|uniref:Uncharacterized protein n=1 Tax=Coemansia reversa (strain ATCC 12441 / NRRL 1564) TaxID=763665 RepID=A0A2G5BDT3_COERN|nr:hypothetical protein COEREDRAFT_80849 [Coemansia reversa NRRL 1564]|eukprot:PIA17165.1 hypothetical protein COEREDRAFT_80849 [Coemansia reversa NRRL 1564]